MTPETFCYWLNGFSELSDVPPTPEQWKSIQEHLALVFVKVTPPVDIPTYTPSYPSYTPFIKYNDLFGPIDLTKVTITC